MLSVLTTVFAVAACVISSFYVFGAHYHVPGGDLVATWWTTLTFLASIGAAVMLCWRHRWPTVVLGIALVPSLLMVSDALAALIALAAFAAHRRDWQLVVASLAVYAATALAVLRDFGRHPDVTVFGRFFSTEPVAAKVIGTLVIASFLTAIPLAVGVWRGMRKDLTARETRERQLREEMARRQERTRIAREMHDVLGHRLTLLSLQAGALEVTNGGSADVARTVRTTARQSLDDLRQVIGVLRDGEGGAEQEDAPSVAPQPSLTDIPELVAGARRSGLTVNLTVLLEETAGAPAPLGTAAYRILQEALTNVLRHAPGQPTEVSVRGGPGAGVTIEVVNPLPAKASPSPGSGTGLAGLAERAAVVGGNVTAGPTDDGWFALRAVLPWERG
ncbi:two-component sensor histidine kinase [Amycolatopsis suaedae]|uniref:histidine kinase n=1 Tax=Amycolatopsis suaedae TaxID=2510978 RepID=A0A4Q7J3W4_9PSEU|nr:two-component sensor histidine kinase [Amycolatopsis suaedae]